MNDKKYCAEDLGINIEEYKKSVDVPTNKHEKKEMSFDDETLESLKASVNEGMLEKPTKNEMESIKNNIRDRRPK